MGLSEGFGFSVCSREALGFLGFGVGLGLAGCLADFEVGLGFLEGLEGCFVEASLALFFGAMTNEGLYNAMNIHESSFNDIK